MSEQPRHSEGVPELPGEVPPLEVVPTTTASNPTSSGLPRFIDTVDDDADLTDIGVTSQARIEDDSQEPEIVEFLILPLCGRHHRLLNIGIALICAAAVTGAWISKSWFFGGVLSVLHGAMHVAAARLAFTLTARALGMRVGDERDVWAISSVLAGVAILGATVPTPLPAGSGGVILGACVYVIVLKRFTGRTLRENFIICCFHFFVALSAYAILSVYSAARQATSGG